MMTRLVVLLSVFVASVQIGDAQEPKGGPKSTPVATVVQTPDGGFQINVGKPQATEILKGTVDFKPEAGLFGRTKEYCAFCSNNVKKPISAKNDIEAAMVGIAKCGGPCSVHRGGCN